MSSVFRLLKLFDQFFVRTKLAVASSVSAKMYTTSSHGKELLDAFKIAIPPMLPSMHKGVCGRIAVVGGSKEYTGAPYFAGISALKVGADLSHIFCPEAAATVIKTYSPDLIVHPILDRPELMPEFKAKLSNIHALVIGPGLGRDEERFAAVAEVIKLARDMKLPIILDADGLFLILQNPNVIANYSNAILTPNKIEFDRLYEKVLGKNKDGENPPDPKKDTLTLAKTLGVSIVRKGAEDIITDGKTVVMCQHPGSNRRCGGQGDLLSGSMGTFAFWAHNAYKANPKNPVYEEWSPNILAAYGACLLTRECNRLAFQKMGRSMVTEDMIGCIHTAFEQNFEH